MEETVLLNFEIDQGQALTDLKATDKAILDLKNTQAELNKSYKEGSVSQDEFIEENIRLQRQLKREQESRKTLVRVLDTENNSRNAMRQRVANLTKEFNNLNLKTVEGRRRSDELAKEIKKLNEELNKGSKSAGNFKDNIGNYAESIKESIGQTNVAGISIGDLGSKIGSLVNPYTAAIAAGSAFIGVLARGRQTQELFAQASAGVGGALDLLTRDLSEFVFENREATKEVSLFQQALEIAKLRLFGTELTRAAKEAANFERELQKIRIANLTDAQEANRLLEISERLKQNAKDETFSLQERVQFNEERLEIEQERVKLLRAGTDAELRVVQLQIDRIGRQNASFDLLQREAALQTELSALLRDSALKDSEILELQRSITKQLQAQLELNEANRRATERQGSVSPTGLDTAAIQNQVNTNLQIQQNAADAELRLKERLASDLIRINDTIARNEEERAKQSEQFYQTQVQARLGAIATIYGSLSQVFEEGSELQRTFALLAIGADTAEAIAALTAAAEANPANAFTFGGAGIAQFATGLARIFTNIAAAKSYLGFAEGGYTGHGQRDEPAGIVHKGEYVAPKWQVDSPAYRPLISKLESGRLKGYADGGLVTNAITGPIDQQLAVLNAIKNMPRPVVSWAEGRNVRDKVDFKESFSRR